MNAIRYMTRRVPVCLAIHLNWIELTARNIFSKIKMRLIEGAMLFILKPPAISYQPSVVVSGSA